MVQAMRRHVRTVIAPLLMIGGLLVAPSAHGRATPISLGQVTSSVKRPHVDVQRTFRSEVEHQLAQVQLPDVRDDERLVLSASLLRLETEMQGERAETTCIVSATLRRQKGGALVAVLRGKAQAEDARKAAASNELAALRAAVRSAMRGVPQALQ